MGVIRFAFKGKLWFSCILLGVTILARTNQGLRQWRGTLAEGSPYAARIQGKVISLFFQKESALHFEVPCGIDTSTMFTEPVSIQTPSIFPASSKSLRESRNFQSKPRIKLYCVGNESKQWIGQFSFNVKIAVILVMKNTYV